MELNQKDSEILGITRTPPSGGSSMQSASVGTSEPHPSIQEQPLDTVTSLVEKTQHAILLEDIPLHKNLAQIYRELGKNRTQLQRLAQILETYAASWRERSRISSRTDTEADDIDAAVVRPLSELSRCAESDATDIFFNCVSRYSEGESDASIERSRAIFSGSPDYFFEGSSKFFPEQYTLISRFTKEATVVAMVERAYTSTYRLQKYFLIYAETPRNWRRVTVSATIITASQNSAFSGIASLDVVEEACRTLPGNLQSQLERVLRSKRLLETVTNVSLIITEDASRQFGIDAANVGITEDLEEVRLSNEETILQDIEHIGCPRFVQSNVIVRSRKNSHNYIVQVESRFYIEQKLPFAGAGLQDDDGVSDFHNDLKLLHSLRDCRGVVKFAGVVLDDTRKHLKSYLYEWPALGSICRIFNLAEARGERIPWEIREEWVKQIIAAVSNVHAKGIVLGLLHLNSVCIRADGSAVLTAPRASGRRPTNRNGYLAPELRSKPCNTPSLKELNFRTDVFQLGFALWLLAEHRTCTNGYYYCPRNACTSMPRYSCNREHNNPVELPPCSSAEVPKYMDAVISHCRQNNPRARMPARELLQYFHEKSSPPQMADLAIKYPETDSDHFDVHCDECGMLTTDLHYHCNTCNLGDFDLCSNCVSQGVHCFVPKHQLTKRTRTDGRIVNASQ